MNLKRPASRATFRPTYSVDSPPPMAEAHPQSAAHFLVVPLFFFFFLLGIRRSSHGLSSKILRKEETDRVRRYELASGNVLHIIGTAHVSQRSCELVEQVIHAVKPDSLVLELCAERLDFLTTGVRSSHSWWDEYSESGVLGCLMTWFYDKIGTFLECRPGAEFFHAAQAFFQGKPDGLVYLGDREVSETLARAWDPMSYWQRLKLIWEFGRMLTALNKDDPSGFLDKVEDMMSQPQDALMTEFETRWPTVYQAIKLERDLYLARSILTLLEFHPGASVVAVVGYNHLDGIEKHLIESNLLAHNQLPYVDATFVKP